MNLRHKLLIASIFICAVGFITTLIGYSLFSSLFVIGLVAWGITYKSLEDYGLTKWVLSPKFIIRN